MSDDQPQPDGRPERPQPMSSSPVRRRRELDPIEPVTPETPSPRPRPARPDIAVTPMREPVSDERPPLVDVGVVLWILAVLSLAVTAFFVAIEQSEVRAELSRSLAADNASRSVSSITKAVDIAMIASGAIALVIALMVVVACIRCRERTISGRGTLAYLGILTPIGAIAFWTVIAPARDLLNPIGQWSPFAVAGLAVVATAVLYAPPVGRWLRAGPKR